MEQNNPTSAVLPGLCAQVVVLRCPDQLHFDPGPLNRLFLEMEAAAAEDVVCRALENIASRLDVLQDGLLLCDFAGMAKPALRIGVIAGQIGLTEVATAAGHVAACVGQGDGIAVEATSARLERGFDVAVSEVWNFRDLV